MIAPFIRLLESTIITQMLVIIIIIIRVFFSETCDKIGQGLVSVSIEKLQFLKLLLLIQNFYILRF